MGSRYSILLEKIWNELSPKIQRLKRERYMRDVYSQTWITNRHENYGFSAYDKAICYYIEYNFQSNDLARRSKLLDVAVGTGYPIAEYFVKSGFSVHGIDIAPNLINYCERNYPEINTTIGNVNNMDYPNNMFDLTYCFHSTWYFPSLLNVIKEMLRVTALNGKVIFDIQNRNNKFHTDIALKLQDPFVRRWLKNLKNMILKDGPVIWKRVIQQTPTYPETIYKFLMSHGCDDFFVMAWDEQQQQLVKMTERLPYHEYARLIFIVSALK